MPEYKKKKVKKTKKAIKNTYTEEIKMSPKRERKNSVKEKTKNENNSKSKEAANTQQKPRVIRGRKLINKCDNRPCYHIQIYSFSVRYTSIKAKKHPVRKEI